MSTNDNSINARFCRQTRIRSRVISMLSATPTDCLKNKVCLWICFPRKKNFSAIFDFHFCKNHRFRDEFQALMFVLFVSCVCKRIWRRGGWSAVKSRKSIFAYVAKRKSSSRTLYTCRNRVKKKIIKFFFDFESLVLRKFRKITAISHPWNGVRTHVDSKGKIRSTGKFSSKKDRTHDMVPRRTASPTHYQLNYSPPPPPPPTCKHF